MFCFQFNCWFYSVVVCFCSSFFNLFFVVFNFFFFLGNGMHLKGKRLFEINWLYVVRVCCERGHAQKPTDNKKKFEVIISDDTTVELLLGHRHNMVLLFVVGMGSLACCLLLLLWTCNGRMPSFLSLKFVLYHTLLDCLSILYSLTNICCLL